jgi:peptide/nickel transport system substrate-binding protein
MNRLPRRTRGLALAVLASASLAAACAPGIATGRGSVVRIGWAGSPDSLNPGAGILAESYVLFGLVYDALYQLNLDNTFSLCLAESAAASEDGRTWTFRLRRGATFHDGTPVTSSDVRFSLDLYKNHAEFPFLHGYTDAFEAVEAPDPATVTLHLSHPVPNLDSQLVFLFILPEHVWAPHAERPVEFANDAMVGSGPFRLEEIRSNEYVRLAAHKNHPTAAPKIDEVVFITYGSLDALVQALRSGEVDMITEMPATAVAALRRAPGIEVAAGAPMSPNVADIKLNQMDPARCPPGGICSGHPALRDVRLRRALAMATPKQQMIDVVLLGTGVPGLTLIPDGLVRAFNPTLTDYPFDVAAAARLLDEAGYRDRDGDGVRETPDGSRRLELRLFFPSDSPGTPRAAEILSRAWSRIGVRLDRRAVDRNALAAVRGPVFDYDVILWSWESDPDPSFLLSVMTSSEIANGGNDTGWSDPEYDELFDRQAVELDPSRRKAMIWRMQEIALHGVAYIVPYYPRVVEAFRRDRYRGWRTDEPGLFLEDRSSLSFLEPVTRP